MITLPFAGRKILVVEDNPSVRMTFARVLRNLGFETKEAGDGEEAWKLVREHPETWDLILTDHLMPGMDGLVLTGHLKRLPYKGKIIILSGFISLRDQAGYRELGVDAVLRKPCPPSLLYEVIQQCLGPTPPGAVGSMASA